MSDLLKRRWSELIEKLEASKATQLAISSAAGVSQATVSRILDRCPKRRSKAFVRLCNYALVEPAPTRPADPASSPVLMDVLRQTWDGTPAHAEALADILRAVDIAKNVTRR